MITTAKYSCRCMAQALTHYGVRRAVLSPGSRNAPLAVAFARNTELECKVVIDERSAAFVALGMAIESGEMVAMACTSGSAALNYAPALAEAYYRHIPLIAITADRPEEWIDQDDSQTIRQSGSLAAVVKGSFDIPVCRGNDEGLQRLCRRRIADAMMLATSAPRGPVHINIQVDEPIDAMADISERMVFPELTATDTQIPEAALKRLAEEINAARKVLVVAGFMPPSAKLVSCLSELPENIAILCEAQSNLPCDRFADNIDASLSVMNEQEKADMLSPDIVITIGGALLSRMLKEVMRKQDIRHWSIGHSDHCIDPLLHLEKRIDCSAEVFFGNISKFLTKHDDSDSYKSRWLNVSDRARKRSFAFLANAEWSDYKAMGLLLNAIPKGTGLHLSNGTTVRYAQLFGCAAASRVECNRGVSGIDGCTSTAIGATFATERPILLISGDMSAQYDMGAFGITEIPGHFRMAVLNNGGGGIFRFIKSTRSLPEMEHYLASDVHLPLRQIAEGFGFDYYEADNADKLSQVIPSFFAASERPAILNIITPPQTSAQTILNYFNPKS